MRQIRHFLTMATLAVMGAMMAGCATEDNIIVDAQQPADQTRTITLTTTVTLDGGSATRALTTDGVKTFAKDDQIAVKYKYNGNFSKVDLSDPLEETDISTDGKTATFTVTLTETPDAGCEVRYVYPAAMENDRLRGMMIQNGQDGTFTTLASTFDYCEGTGTMGGTVPNFELPTGVTLKNQLALAKFTISDGTSNDDSDITSDVTQLMIYDGIRGYVVNRTAAAGPIWVAMYPIASSQKIKVTAVKGTDFYQSADITGKELAKNNYYNITVTTPKIDMSNVATELKQPLTFEARRNDTKVMFTLGSTATKPVEYSIDNGTTWTTYTSEQEIELASTGDKVLFRGNNASYGIDDDSNFSVTKGSCYVYGNVMSLVNATAFPVVKTLTAPNVFRRLFYNCSGIDILGSNKIVLPATTLTEGCYSSMFWSCSNLTTVPELPATTLAEECYAQMFWSCSSLTTAPELPATMLAEKCYYKMFEDCTNLTTAPTLPATTLVGGCYNAMFLSCTKLNYVKCLATDISDGGCTEGWLVGVSSSGTFIINDALDPANPTPWAFNDDINDYYSGIPSGWTVKRASDP